MTRVGIRELKAHLSRYLKKVSGGEEVYVTERGNTVAVIVPVAAADDELRRTIARLMADGLLASPGPKPRFEEPRVRLRRGTVSSAVIEDRR